MKNIHIIILLVLLSNIQLFANIVATVTALKGSATIQRETKDLEAKIGSKLENKDSVITTGNSKMQIIFKDETILTIGKNSHFSIEEYLYEQDKEPIAKFSVLKGAMRVITGGIGKIAPHKFSVKTRTATIGIRGTNFTVIVRQDGSFIVYCTYGAISVVYDSNQHIVKQSYFIEVSSSGEVKLDSFNSDKLKAMKEKYFPKEKQTDEDSTKGNEDNDNKAYEESNQRLDVKFKDNEVTLQDLIDTTPDYIVKENYSETDTSIIANYSMEEANYRGSYNTEFSNGTLYESGDAAMTINFGDDTAWLGLGSFQDPNEQARYDFPNINSNQVTGIQVENIGSAIGNFYTSTGNAVNGSFKFGETTSDGVNEITAQGTYDLSTSQVLH